MQQDALHFFDYQINPCGDQTLVIAHSYEVLFERAFQIKYLKTADHDLFAKPSGQ